MGLESALWEATRPAFRVRYIHDPTSTPRVPLYASYGFATGPTARAKLARIVRKAPEVVVKVTGRQRGQELHAVVARFEPYASVDTAIILSNIVVRRLPKL